MGAVRAWSELIANINFSAFAIAVVTLAVGIMWPTRLKKFLAGPVVALSAGTALGVLWLTSAPVIGEVPTGLPTPRIPDVSFTAVLHSVQPALIIALLGSIDSLLTSLVADSMTRTRHSPNRELVGQGIGNMAAGIFGGLPGEGSTMGTGNEHPRRRTHAALRNVAGTDSVWVGPRSRAVC